MYVGIALCSYIVTLSGYLVLIRKLLKVTELTQGYHTTPFFTTTHKLSALLALRGLLVSGSTEGEEMTANGKP